MRSIRVAASQYCCCCASCPKIFQNLSFSRPLVAELGKGEREGVLCAQLFPVESDKRQDIADCCRC